MGVNVGDQIKKFRIEKGLTQEELADAIGNTKAAISRYELNQRQPRMDQLIEIAKALDVLVVDLLGPYDGPPLPGLVDGDKMEDVAPVDIPSNFKATGTLHVRVRARKRIDNAVDQMTPEGQDKVADYAEDILPRYRREDTPPPSPPTADTPGTPPPPESPENGG